MASNAVLERVTQAQEWALEQMKANQERLIDLNRRLASLVEKRAPAVKLPFAERLPDPKAVVERYFDFVTKSTKANRHFAEQLIDAWRLDGTTTPATKAAAARRAHKAS